MNYLLWCAAYIDINITNTMTRTSQRHVCLPNDTHRYFTLYDVTQPSQKFSLYQSFSLLFLSLNSWYLIFPASTSRSRLFTQRPNHTMFVFVRREMGIDWWLGWLKVLNNMCVVWLDLASGVAVWWGIGGLWRAVFDLGLSCVSRIILFCVVGRWRVWT